MPAWCCSKYRMIYSPLLALIKLKNTYKQGKPQLGSLSLIASKKLASCGLVNDGGLRMGSDRDCDVVCVWGEREGGESLHVCYIEAPLSFFPSFFSFDNKEISLWQWQWIIWILGWGRNGWGLDLGNCDMSPQYMGVGKRGHHCVLANT